MNIVTYVIDDMKKFIFSNFSKETQNSIFNYAACLMRRFYLKKTLLDSDAKRMMCTCILLATKLAEVNVNIQEMIKKMKIINSQRYIKTELKLMTALKFNLHIEDSYTALFSLYDRFLEISKIKKNEVDISYLSSQIMLYYKSDLFFTWHPLYFNLFLMKNFIKKKNLEIEVSSLVNLNPALVEKLNREILTFEGISGSLPSKSECKTSAGKFVKFYQAVQEASQKIQVHKRPKAVLVKRNSKSSE